jgi:hypothetical protein
MFSVHARKGSNSASRRRGEFFLHTMSGLERFAAKVGDQFPDVTVKKVHASNSR